MNKKTSTVWKYFEIKTNNGKKEAICKLCEDTYAYHGATSILSRHLTKKHRETQQLGEAKESSEAKESGVTKELSESEFLPQLKKSKIDGQPKINSLFKAKKSLQYEVSKLVAHDGLTFRQVASSTFIQAHLQCE